MLTAAAVLRFQTRLYPEHTVRESLDTAVQTAVPFKLYIDLFLQTIISLLASQRASFITVYLALTGSLKVECYFQTVRGA